MCIVMMNNMHVLSVTDFRQLDLEKSTGKEQLVILHLYHKGDFVGAMYGVETCHGLNRMLQSEGRIAFHCACTETYTRNFCMRSRGRATQ